MYALEYLRQKVVASLEIDLTPSLALDVKYRFQQRRGSYTDTNGINRTYRPYQLVDACLAWSKPALLISTSTSAFGRCSFTVS